MYPELFSLPFGLGIRTYGFCMMVGFLSAVWLAMRRATRVKADPDVVLDMAFLSLLFGVGGARAMYVIHYWKSQFADAPNKFFEIINITQGGLEFLGGFLGATAAVIVYGIVRRQSLRLYLDVMAPGAMWGLAFGRIGCFFNGCCFGGLCLAAGQGGHADHAHGVSAPHPALPWAVRFPYGSPAQARQWEERKITLPAELIVTSSVFPLPGPIPDRVLHKSVEKREGPIRELVDLREAFARAKHNEASAEELDRMKVAIKAAEGRIKEHIGEIKALQIAQSLPSRIAPNREASVTEIQDLASDFRSLPVHPAQLYASLHAFLLSGFLSALFYVRKRHGVVIGALLVMYAVPRMFEEAIRADNPADVSGLTVSQFISLMLLVTGLSYLFILYRYLPERSPLAVAAARKDEAK